jgi:hypothetical protein
MLRNNIMSFVLGRILWTNSLSDGIWPEDSELGTKGGHPNESTEGTTQIKLTLSGSAGGQMEGGWHRTSRRMKKVVFWDVTPCGSCKNRRFVVPSLSILVILIETLRSSETSVLTKATRRSIPEHGFLHSYRRENLNSYTAGEFPFCCGMESENHELDTGLLVHNRTIPSVKRR